MISISVIEKWFIDSDSIKDNLFIKQLILRGVFA